MCGEYLGYAQQKAWQPAGFLLKSRAIFPLSVSRICNREGKQKATTVDWQGVLPHSHPLPSHDMLLRDIAVAHDLQPPISFVAGVLGRKGCWVPTA